MSYCLICFIFLAVQYLYPLAHHVPAYHSSTPSGFLEWPVFFLRETCWHPHILCPRRNVMLLLSTPLLPSNTSFFDKPYDQNYRVTLGFQLLTSVILTFAVCHCSHSFYPNHSLNSCKGKNMCCVRIICAY